MLGVSSKDDCDGIELSLELSIGGCYKELEKPLKEKTEDDVVTESEKLSDVSDAFVVGHAAAKDENGLDHQQRKRDFHALRRQEARRKKAEKQKRSMMTSSSSSLSKEKGCFEAQKFQGRVEDREKRETEKIEEFARKNIVHHVQDLNVAFNQSSQYMPYVNGGLGNSCGFPFWGNNQSVGKQRDENDNEKNVNNTLFTPVASRNFKPCQNGYANANASGDLSQISSVGFDSVNNNGGKSSGHGNHRAVSNGSLERSSSAFSDYQSTSQKGGSCSTDTGGHSNCSQGYQQQQLSASATSAIFAQSEINATSSQINSHQANGEAVNLSVKPATSNIATPERPESQKPAPVNNPTSMPQEPTSSSSKGSSEVANKPPKPQTNNQGATPVRQMPFVSTTGNGPNGKTVNGFLYRYNKTEVCIVCVCHGSSFSPAEFVEHAGGVDISHPLRHITIVPASFG